MTCEECAAPSSSFGFECSGNRRPLQGLSSNGRWTGVPLKAVLDQAGVKPQAREFVFFGADHGEEEVDFRGDNHKVDQQFGRSLPREKALVARAASGLRVERRTAHPPPGLPAAPARSWLVRRGPRQMALQHPRSGRAVSRKVPGPLVPHVERRNDRRRDEVEGDCDHPHAVEIFHRARHPRRQPATRCSASC